ncbi:MAG: hypothetical protein GAK31_03881 [Stenotrophomonas maltophilia]|uniref:PoNi C-terminal domain-containing protein n=1 Tax=Stenotrophomonas maltophilia TaxID=40324 RepID=A0A7V8JK22_STEMA|nr:MAG: hypothetical protein GAK31_03881 [Stenotrophomonas maltophilia]
MPLQNPDWKEWMARKVSGDDFALRREPQQRNATYLAQFQDTVNGIAMVTIDLPTNLSRASPGGLMTSTRRRLWDSLDWLCMQYSAGAPTSGMSDVWPYVLGWAEEYARYDKTYDDSAENTSGDRMPHVTLRDEEYWIVALRMVCFGILTGNANDMPRVMAFLDYVNAELGIHDGLLERLVALWAPGRPQPGTTTRNLPYRRLLKVFDASPDKRPALMATYLQQWYEASKREPYFNQHGEGDIAFYGYWSWEAAAATVALGIDDASYRDMAFYPKDLVDYARHVSPGSGRQALRENTGDPGDY